MVPLSAGEVAALAGDARGDELVVRLATPQDGVVARWQLELAGMGERAVGRRIGRTLRPLFQGVFLLGPPGPRALATAGLLAAGEDARLCFHSAAHVWEFVKAPFGVVHVTVPGARRESRKGLRFHVAGDFEPRFVDGLPMTSPAATVVDMATVLDKPGVIALVDQALMTDHLTPAELEAAVVPSRRNVGLLREILEDGGDLAAAKSRAEQRMVRLIRRGGLPKPEVNVCVAGEQFDFVWRRERLIVEYDSLKYHRTPARIANDARKQRLAHDAGFRVDRLTKGDLYREPQRLLGWLARALAQT